MARSCVWCQRDVPLTLEHVFPGWLLKEMPDQHLIRGVAHTQRREGVELRKWTAARMDSKVRRVCGRCNNGWMSQLEKTARLVLSPLLAGRTKKLSPVEQEIVTVWALKTALMAEFLDPISRAATPEHFEGLYNGLKPTPNAHVWLAHYLGPKDIDYNHRVLHFPESEHGSVPGRNGYLSAFVFNKLVLYVMDVAITPGAVTRTTLDDAGEENALPIHPLKYAVLRWPPDFAVTDEGVKNFLLAIAPERGEPPVA